MTTNQTIGGMPSKCGACGGTSLTWFASNENRSGVPEGRLRTHEVSSVFVLGCDDCSETLRVVGADKMASLLNNPAAQPQGEPVATVMNQPYGMVFTDYKESAFPIGVHVDLYAEHPAPVAVVPSCCGSCPGGCVIGAKP